MIQKEEWVLIRGLSCKFKQGLSVSEIARQTGHDRKTIRKYLSAEEKPKYGAAKRSSKLDPYKDYITDRLKEVPEITNRRILREINAKGYTGSYTILSDFIGPLREERQNAAVIRFETMPGEQSQVDWSYFGYIEEYGIKKRVYCFSMVLGYSRMIYIEFTTSQDVFNFIRCHQNAFLYFGGYTRTILYDNTKTVVISRCGGNIEWNKKFMDFVGFYGFEPRVCRVYRAQTKGKVERPFGYIRQDFFIGNKYENIEDLNSKALMWLNSIANSRVHGTTKEVPFERLKNENLLPLTKDRLYDTSFIGARKASKDCHISYEGNRYSIPYQYIRKTLTIKADNEQIAIYNTNNEKIATHSLFRGKGKDISDSRHFEGLKIKQKERWESFKERFLSLSPAAKEYWDGFLSSVQMRGRWWELRKINSLCEKHSLEDVDYVLLRALKHKAFGYKYIEGILEQIRSKERHGMQTMGGILKEILSKWEIPQVEERPLSNYDEFLNQ